MEAKNGYEYVMSIGDQLGEYAGKWIVVYNNEITDSHEDFSIAYKSFKEKYPGKTPFVMKVVKESSMLL